MVARRSVCLVYSVTSLAGPSLPTSLHPPLPDLPSTVPVDVRQFLRGSVGSPLGQTAGIEQDRRSVDRSFSSRYPSHYHGDLAPELDDRSTQTSQRPTSFHRRRDRRDYTDGPFPFGPHRPVNRPDWLRRHLLDGRLKGERKRGGGEVTHQVRREPWSNTEPDFWSVRETPIVKGEDGVETYCSWYVSRRDTRVLLFQSTSRLRYLFVRQCRW